MKLEFLNRRLFLALCEIEGRTLFSIWNQRPIPHPHGGAGTTFSTNIKYEKGTEKKTSLLKMNCIKI